MLASPSDTRASLIVRLRDQEDRDAWDEVMALRSAGFSNGAATGFAAG
jgi:hypothetical protein